jgi:XTP/dITP diphosphohydrolase
MTTAEMDPAAKDAISHRGRALRALAPVIAAMVG